MNDKYIKRTPFGIIYQCRECGEYIDMYIYDKDNYAYKSIVSNNQFLYFCSWHCMRKYEETHKRKEFTKLIGRKKYLSRKYNK